MIIAYIVIRCFLRLVGEMPTGKYTLLSLSRATTLLQILKNGSHAGPRGGVRISFDALGGAYLREADLVGLIKSGYLGTHRKESEALTALIAEVARGNRALVLAWQRRVELEAKNASGFPSEDDTDRIPDDDLPF